MDGKRDRRDLGHDASITGEPGTSHRFRLRGGRRRCGQASGIMELFVEVARGARPAGPCTDVEKL
jgi:hypothetical protein